MSFSDNSDSDYEPSVASERVAVPEEQYEPHHPEYFQDSDSEPPMDLDAFFAEDSESESESESEWEEWPEEWPPVPVNPPENWAEPEVQFLGMSQTIGINYCHDCKMPIDIFSYRCNTCFLEYRDVLTVDLTIPETVDLTIPVIVDLTSDF